MRSRRSVSVVLGALLALGAVGAACDTGDDDDETPAATLTPADRQAAVAQEVAEALCPDEGQDVCREQFVIFATGTVPLAFCVRDDDTWFFEEPAEGAVLGDECTQPGGYVHALVGGSTAASVE